MSKLHVVAEPGTQTIVLTRVFDAPKALTFKVFLDPNHLAEWWGPRSHTTVVDKMDVRPGGEWRFISRDASGGETGFRGVYREIAPPERVVYTFEYEPMPGYISLEVVAFDERDGRTTLTNTVHFHTVEDRDGMLASGMETGAAETMDRLADLLEAMRVKI